MEQQLQKLLSAFHDVSDRLDNLEKPPGSHENVEKPSSQVTKPDDSERLSETAAIRITVNDLLEQINELAKTVKSNSACLYQQ